MAERNKYSLLCFLWYHLCMYRRYTPNISAPNLQTKTLCVSSIAFIFHFIIYCTRDEVGEWVWSVWKYNCCYKWLVCNDKLSVLKTAVINNSRFKKPILAQIPKKQTKTPLSWSSSYLSVCSGLVCVCLWFLLLIVLSWFLSYIFARLIFPHVLV